MKGLISISPTIGHIAPQSSKEVTLTFNATQPVKLENAGISCTLKKIVYTDSSIPPVDNPESAPASASTVDHSLRGRWDNAMKVTRPATEADLSALANAKALLEDYNTRKAAEEAKGKKGKPVGPPPEPINLQLAPDSDDGEKMIFEIVPEPEHSIPEDQGSGPPQILNMKCVCTADIAKFTCNSENYITFVPTYMFQTMVHKFTFNNESNITLPVNWVIEEQMRRRLATRMGTSQSVRTQSRGVGTAALPQTSSYCPFTIEPSTCEIAPKSEQTFTIKFLPLDAGEFEYILKGETPDMPPTSEGEPSGPIRIGIFGTGTRPICHFEINETPDYLNRRPGNLKNEIGLFSPIECGNLRAVELESIGLRTRNTFRFHVINPTSENYDFIWESVGEPSPFWRCVQGSGMVSLILFIIIHYYSLLFIIIIHFNMIFKLFLCLLLY